jgi:hypothetical protein
VTEDTATSSGAQPLGRRFPTGVGQSDTRAKILSEGRTNPHPSAGSDYGTITGQEIAKMVVSPGSVAKENARWFIPSTYIAFDARDHSVQRQRGEFWWLGIDLDENNLSLSTVTSALDVFSPGGSRIVYSTRSSKPEDRRWRALLPLEEFLPGPDYTDTAMAFFAALTESSDGLLIPDPKLARTGQLIYLPNRGEFYEHEVLRGNRLHLTPDHPVIRRRDADRATAQAARHEAAQKRARKAAQASAPGDEETLVAQFNAANSIAGLLERYRYERLGDTDHWRSPFQTSGSFATRDGGDHWVSLSGSDAAAGLGTASKSGARFGDAFDLFAAYEHGGDFRQALRAYGDECRSSDWSSVQWTGSRNDDTTGGANHAGNTETKRDTAGSTGEGASNGSSHDGHPGANSGQNETPARLPTEFAWRDPELIPPRAWLYSRHLLRGQISVTVAPGGVGKSSLTIVEALAMASGRRLLGDWVSGKLRVWLLNLEDPADELERRIAAAMQHHRVAPEELAGRLYVDSGRDRPFCTARQMREGVRIDFTELDAMVAEIRQLKIDVLIVDPFISSHVVNENDNGAIDLVVKQFWAALAERCNCAVELVHHTRKLGGEEGTSEAGRGASALLGAARSGRVLNRMTREERERACIPDSDGGFFSVTRDKANLAPPGKREWRRVVPVDLANGDSVGVVEAWTWPDDFDGVGQRELLAVQNAIHDSPTCPRYSDQASGWVGDIVARVLGLDAGEASERKRIKRMIEVWLRSGALVKVTQKDEGRQPRPCVEVGEWATQ